MWSFGALTGECDVSDNTVGSVLLGVDSLWFSTPDDAIPSAPARIRDSALLNSPGKVLHTWRPLAMF